jgi:hypothetical protein
MTVEGIWDLTISTPVGTTNAELELHTRDGALTGTANGGDEHVALSNIVAAGDRLTWSQAITKPVRLKLAFDMTVAGDTMTGKAKAGLLPTSKVTGHRRISS